MKASARAKGFAGLFFSSLALSFTASAAAGPGSALQQAALQELSVLQGKFNDEYAPGALKAQRYGWNLSAEVTEAQQGIQALPFGRVIDYQRILRHFEMAAHDYHVTIAFDSPETSVLPFRVRTAGGRFFVAEVVAPAAPVQVGDELIEFDSQPVADAVTDIQRALGYDVNPASDLARAAAYLTSRPASSTLDVPQGNVDVVFIPVGQSAPLKLTFQWQYTPPEATAISTPHPVPSANAIPNIIAVPNGQAVNPSTAPVRDGRVLVDGASADDGLPGAPASLPPAQGAKLGVLPALGNITWEAPDSDAFQSYIFTAGGQSYGFIRIADFDGDEARTEDLAALIAKMEPATAALVIDERDNPGGQSYYLDAVASLLITNPIPTAKFYVALSKDSMQTANHELSELATATSDLLVQKALGAADYNGYPISLSLGQSVRTYDQFLSQQQTLRHHIAGPHYRKLETIVPRPGATTYSKPILILTNESDYSCADMFPALMQDVGRASTFGATTSGAGGNNNIETAAPGLLGIKQTSITISSELRPSGTYLEDAGVSPDFPYAVTADDLQNGYAGYILAVQAALTQLAR